jgi:hypothetical protein
MTWFPASVGVRLVVLIHAKRLENAVLKRCFVAPSSHSFNHKTEDVEGSFGVSRRRKCRKDRVPLEKASEVF